MSSNGRLRTAAARLGTAVGIAWRAHPWALAGYVAVSLIDGALPVAAVWLTKTALDRLAAASGSAGVLAAGAALAVVGLGTAAASPLRRYLQAELGRAVALRTKDQLYRAVNGISQLDTLETPSFRDQLRLAEQASRSGPGQVVDSGLGAARAAVTLVGMAAAVAVVSPWVAAALVAAAAPALFAEIQLSRRRAEMMWRISPAERREFFYTELLTSLSAAKEIRLFGSGPLFHRRMLAELAASNAHRRRFDRRELAVQGLLSALSALLAGGALVWVLLGAARGQLSVGDVAAVIVAVGSVQLSLAAAVDHFAAGHHAGLLLDHYRALVRAAPDAATPGGGPTPGGGARGIELVDIWFRYGAGQPWALRGVSAVIPEGRAIALVGENGSGKSTLVKLLCRFYDPTRGCIRWDGVDIRELPVAELRDRIGAVFQDFMSYDLTAEENIALGDVDGRAELDLRPPRIVDAARRAEADGFVTDLPHGYRTLLSRTFVDYDDGCGAEGVLLSGGQWQRVALARALLRSRRDLLILDEPSSGLDAEAEHRVHRQITELRRGRTSVLVSHRLNTVRDADQIWVLAGGRLVEQGSHEELLAAAGAYARLFRLQAAGYQPVEVQS